MTVEDAVKLMRDNQVRRLRTDDFEIEMAPGAFGAQQAAEAEAAPLLQVCICGHDLTEHNEAGCLRGCPDEKCAPPEPAKSASWTATVP